jgi:TonB-dependent starch-binding outer membrane protein SusC
MRKKRLLVRAGVFCLLILLGIPAFSQNKPVSGKITDSSGRPLPGVSVIPKGSARGTTTDQNGAFQLNVPTTTRTLILSSIGYVTREVSADGTAVSIVLKSGNSTLNDVIVIGYGTTKRKDLTGSIATVTAKDFNPGMVSSADQLIQGKISGVVVTPNSGQPGIGSTIRIRGGSSLNASNDPLYVIDGVPLSTTTINGAANPQSLINQDDIETITVLKDASATAIYGDRASNGVILITTKKGRQGGAFRVTLNTVDGLSKAAAYQKVLSAAQFRQVVDEKGTAAQQALMGSSTTDWQKQIYQTATSSDNNLAFTGGIKDLPYRLSLGYLGQDGILKTGYLKRSSVALNVSPSLLNNHLKVDINVKGSITDNRFANAGAVGDATQMDPTQSVRGDTSYNKYGGYWEWTSGNVPNSQSTRNPLAELYAKKDISTIKRSIGNIQLDYSMPFMPELKATVNTGYDIARSNGSTYTSPVSAIGYNNGGSIDHYTQYNRNELFDFYLNYAKQLKELNSHIDLTAGYEYQDFYRAAPGTTTYSVLGTSPATGLAVIPTTALADSTENTLVSFYGRLNYTFADRFLLTATIRRDGSSRFAPHNHWGNFPSAALAWRLKQESFLKDVDMLSELKVRVSYGVTGNQDITSSYYPYTTSYTTSTSTTSYLFGNTPYNTQRPASYDPNIVWESTATYDAGLDYGFLNNRINGSLDFYTRKTSNLIASVPVSEGSNLSNYLTTNVGDLTSKGVEFNVNAGVVATKKVNWNVGFNIAYNEYKITKLFLPGTTIPTGNINGGTGNYAQIQAAGYTRNVFYLEKQVYGKNGAPIEGLYADVNNNPNNLLYYSKSPDPKVTLGFNTQFGYQNWIFSFSMHGDLGNYMYNNFNSNNGAYNSIFNSTGFLGNASANVLKTNFATKQYLSDYYLENASFLRMDNMLLGYNFGRVANGKVGIRLSAIVQNAFVITKYTGIDPEVPGGIDNNIYPKARTYSLALNLDL